MIRFALIFLAGLVSAPGLAPSASEAFVVGDGSRFWIDGTTSVNRFTCGASQVVGFGTVESDTVEAGGGEAEVDAVVVVAVRGFDCGIRQMNSDFYEALKGREHPAVRFALHRAEVVAPPGGDGWAGLRAWGTLALAGAERPIIVRAEGRRFAGGRVELRGTHALRMTDFNIDPPRGPLGLVRAHDQITVRFDLVAQAK